MLCQSVVFVWRPGLDLFCDLGYNPFAMDEQKTVEQGDDRKTTEELKAQCDEYLNGWKRAKADFVNYQKDEMKRFEEVMKFSNQQLIKDLLVALDSLNLAAADGDKVFALIKNQLEDVLRRHGVEKINISVGQSFDPAYHEAVAEVDSADQPYNTVAEIAEDGYTLHGKVIRAAKVKVAK